MLRCIQVFVITILLVTAASLQMRAQDFDFLVATYLVAGVTDNGDAYSGTAEIVEGDEGYHMTRCIDGRKEIVPVKKDKFVLGGDGPVVAYTVDAKEARYKYRVFVDLGNYATLVGYGGERAHEHLIHREMDEFICKTDNNEGEE